MPKVKLKGLNIRSNSAGKWYVSYRKTGKALLVGFSGTREALDKEMGTARFLLAYSREQAAAKAGIKHADGTLGALIDWYETRDEWTSLRARTQEDYKKVKAFLSDAMAFPYLEIATEDVLDLRDKASADRYMKFSNDVVAYLSAVFRTAVDGRKMKSNPALGVKRLYKSGDDANRAWTEEEYGTALSIAPEHIRLPLIIARHAGLRGQDIAILKWGHYAEHKHLGMALKFTPLKNGEKIGDLEIGAGAQLRAALDSAKAGGVLPSAPICRNRRGRQYPSENAMRKVWQDFKASEAFKAALPNSADLTLHGLRVTYASDLRERGFTDREIADMLGDLTESMGRRYARGARMVKTSKRVLKRLAEEG